MRALIITIVLVLAACRGGAGELDGGDPESLEADYLAACEAQCQRDRVECTGLDNDCAETCARYWNDDVGDDTPECIAARTDYSWCVAGCECRMDVNLRCVLEMNAWIDCDA